MWNFNKNKFMISMGKFYRERINAPLVINVILCLIYAGIKIINTENIIHNVQKSDDTVVYVGMASHPIFSSAFLAGARPFTVPLIYKLFDSNFFLIAFAQTIFSILCWSFLAFQLRKVIQSVWLKEAAFILIFLFSLSENIIGWDTVMLSESISISFMALFLAGWLWILNGWKWQKLIFLIVAAFFWVFSRETNAWIILIIGGITAVIGIWKRANWRYFIFTGIFFLFFAANEVSSNLGHRWTFPFLNVLTQRILPDKQNTAFFSEYGMPITPALVRMSGKWASSENRAFFKDSALENFRKWLYSNGKSTYIHWLLSRPYKSLKEPVANIKGLLSFKGKVYYTSGFSPVLPAVVESIIYPNDHLTFVVLLLCFVSIIVFSLTIVAKAYRYNSVWIVLLSMILLIYPHAFLVWHGDAMEIGRHSLQLGIQFFLCTWMVILFTGDYILNAKSKSKFGTI